MIGGISLLEAGKAQPAGQSINWPNQLPKDESRRTGGLIVQEAEIGAQC
jgi:hypothetical protein